MGGRIVSTALWGLLLFLFLALDLVLFGVLALNSVGVTVLPLLGAGLGALLGWKVAQQSAGAPAGVAPAVVAPVAATAYPADAATVAPPTPPSPYAPQPAPYPPEATPGFVPTHTVPASGLPAWAAPDPNTAAVANLDAWLGVQVVAWQGDWAEILCANGWQAWVNGRLLVPRPS